ncbi:MAG: AAA family ATPase [Christensenella sp.]|nr:AAA family ATPase [Christensenella sp.]
MRPVKLTMQAFGSYGKKTIIDFTAPNQNLFLITGNTGAGKTTIFDAIVYAIYGEASSGYNKKSGVELQSQFVDYSTEPFVELVFSEVVGGATLLYTVRRVPRHIRPLKKGSGFTDEKESVSLTMPDGSPFIQNQKETDSKLEEIVGLTKNQFMQVAMIAQGEFMDLLRADSTKKKEIFRKLFNTGLFQVILDELDGRRRGKLAEIAQIRTACQTEVSHVVVPETYHSAEKVLEVKRRILTSDKLNITDMETLLAELEFMCQWLLEERDSAKTAFNQSSEIRDLTRDSYNSAKALLLSFVQFEKAEQELIECKLAEGDMREATHLITQINAAYEIKAAYQRFGDADQLVADAEKQLKEQEIALPALMAANSEAEAAETSAKVSLDAELELFAKISERVATALDVFKRMHAAEVDIEAAQENVRNADELTRISQKALIDFEIQEKEWRKKAEELADAGKHLALWEVKNTEATGIATDIATARKLQDDVQTQKRKADRAQQDYENVRQQYVVKNDELVAKQNAFLDAQAGFIAKEKLIDGEPCPVCGSKDHPRPCELLDEHKDLTRKMIEDLAIEVTALQKDQTSKSTESGSALDLLAEKQTNLIQTMVKLRGRIVISIANASDGLTLSQLEELLIGWRSELQAEGITLSKNASILASIQESLTNADANKFKLKEVYDAASQQFSDAKTQLATREETLKGLNQQSEYLNVEEAEAALKKVTEAKNTTNAIYITAHEVAQTAKTAKENAEVLIDRFKKDIPAQLVVRDQRKAAYNMIVFEKGIVESEWMDIILKHKSSEVAGLQEKIDAYKNKKASAEGARSTAKQVISDQPKPLIESLELAMRDAEASLVLTQTTYDQLRECYKTNFDAYNALAPKMVERNQIIQEHTRIDSLYNRLAGKISGARMDIETFVQRYYLRRILYAANTRFLEMSAGQYELRLIGEDQAGDGKNKGLDLIVFSTVTGKEREVRTLSGGESFIAALALALGMADQIQESSSSINLDIMFIDEGFGSLDDHSRNQAVKVLQQMANGSKLIGIISHVAELKQEIEDQLIVSKNEEGSHIRWLIS